MDHDVHAVPEIYHSDQKLPVVRNLWPGLQFLPHVTFRAPLTPHSTKGTMASLTDSIAEQGTIPWVYLNMNGRIGRQAYWLSLIANSVVVFALSFIGSSFLDIVVGLLSVYVTIHVTGKRFHDRGKSAWWVLLGLIPLIGAIWILIDAGILKGTPGPNAHGTATVKTPFG